MYKVLDLFAGANSVYNAFGKEIDYIGVDIYDPTKKGLNIILDLSQENIIEKLKEKLPDGWRPDFIWASPVCNHLSGAITAGGGNYYFELDKAKKEIKPRENWNIKVQPHMSTYQNEEGRKSARDKAKLTLKLYSNMKKIINYFNIPFIIENPYHAYSQYLLKEYVKNKVDYCAYFFDYKKTTAIYSNKKIKLNTCNHKGIKHRSSLVGGKGFKTPNHWDKGLSVYANRSSVPPELIKHIFKQFKEIRKEDNDPIKSN